MILSSTKIFGKINLRNQATSNIKTKDVLKKLISNATFHMRDNKFSTKDGFVNLHPTKGRYWVCYIENKTIPLDLHHLAYYLIFLLKRTKNALEMEENRKR